MEERLTSIRYKNDNYKRKRLRVKDDRKAIKLRKIENLKQRDRKVKIVLSTLTVIFVLSLASITLIKRNNLKAKRFEYNTLQADVNSYELQRDRLSQKLENAIDINRIQRYALEELGMVYKDDNNTVKLNVDRN
ncbi:hypothetical protein [Anaerococcus tetradius]|jgi:hypothetical protein|uniref:Cell division protein FtsL n=2 Tax=Anaerococcus tetradius TaxID=33036 RepID=C2CGG2_9FIRM|nr:hypothetical protein [Anaerococcus tetradius]EEI83226.1 hypothetical protein HMPREF0077_0572 [Anaerococcus tetradius ATCC 35098]KWZ76031.1 hypothetical protein HMPREF3200_01905 [Anaerococcus tetradius]